MATLPWFAALPPEERSFVGLVVKAGLDEFGSWLRDTSRPPQADPAIFSAAPRALARAVTLVKPGGRIVFSNCSLDPLEGEDLYRAFLAGTAEIANDPLQQGEIAGIDLFLTPQGTLRTTPADLDLGSPGISGLDGFFAARMRRAG